MDFIESLAIRLPDIEAQLSSTDFRESHGLVVELAAIHEGVTANFNRYPALELASSLPTWTSPYPKPVLLHHDPFSEAVGRVIGSRMDKEADDGLPYIRLQVAVTDTEAIRKVKDKRYLTGSVGGKAGKASCTICNADWSKASIFDMPCKHQRGKEYDGKVAMLEMAEIIWKEYSFVNMPADDRSSVRSTVSGTRAVAMDKPKGKEGEDFHSARFFCLDLQNQAISEFSESATRDVMVGLESTAASSLYHALKGAFLSAVAQESKEDNVAPPIKPAVSEETDDDDVLAASEALSVDLSDLTVTPAGEPEDEDPDPEGSAEPADDGAADGDEEPEPEAPAAQEEPEPEEPATGPDGEPTDADEPDPESAEAPGGDEPDAADPADEGEPAAEDDQPGESGDEGSDEPDESDLQARVTALEARESELVEENSRLRAALKKGLAERVVDMKITLGLHVPEDREELLVQHLERSASSLADSLRDLASMPQQRPSWDGAPRVDPAGLAVPSGDENGRDVIVDEDETPAEQQKTLDPEDLFVDVFMGRQRL